MRERYHRGGLVGPICLIALGVLLLLNNMGLLAYSIWVLLLQIWPVLLIAVGIDLLVGRRSPWGALLAFILIVALIGGAIGLVLQERPARQPLTGETYLQSLSGARAAEITLLPAVGTIRVRSFSSPSLLLQATLQPVPGERIVHSFGLQGETEVGTVRSAGLSMEPVARPGSAYNWDILLNDQLPTALQVQFGVGQVELHLTDLEVTKLDLSAGVGQLVVDLPSRGHLSARIAEGIGEIVITVPAGMEARIRVSAALAGQDISSRFQPQGDYFVSAGYTGAANRVDLDLSLALGSLVVR